MKSNQMPLATDPNRRLSPSISLVLFIGTLLLVLWSVIGWGIGRSYTDTDASLRRELSNFSWTFAQTVDESIKTIDVSVQDLRDDWLKQPELFAEVVQIKQRRLVNHVVFQVGIIGADGRLKFSSLEPDAKPVDLSDREHFQVHRTRPSDHLFVSKPVLGRVSKRWSIQFTRPILDAAGHFGGVIVLSVASDHFTRFYETINFRPDSVSTLLQRDGHILARWPAPEGAIGSDFGTAKLFDLTDTANLGWIEMVSKIDQVKRLHVWRKVGTQDLFVVLGISIETMFSAHRVQRNLYLITGAAMTTFLILFGFLFIRAMRRNERISQALRKSEERWKFALEGGGDAVWDWNLATGKVFHSSRWTEILGNDTQDGQFNHEEWIERLHPQDRSQVLQAEQAHLTDQQQRYATEYRLRAKDGSWRWVLDRGMVIRRDAAGAALRMIGTISDISVRRDEQQQLQDSQRFLRTLTDALPSLVGYWRPDMTCSFANLAYQKAFGRTAQALHDLPLQALLGAAKFEKERIYFDGALSGYEQMFECDLSHADGRHAHYWAQYFPDLVDGKVHGVFSLITDVSPLKAAQIKFEKLNRQLLVHRTGTDKCSDTQEDIPGAVPPIAAGASLDLLLVEDYPLNQDYAMGLLAFLGHRATLATNGQEALDWLAKKRFDLVLMDMQMPIMNGLETTQQIRRNEAASASPRVRIIAMSAFALQGEVDQCLAAGMDDFIAKPFSPDDLVKHLDLLVASKK